MLQAPQNQPQTEETLAQPQPELQASEITDQSIPAMVPIHSYKNQLQEYTQKIAIPEPSYHTMNEGLLHAPKFRSSVVINGSMYTSPNVFYQRKAAEMDVARIALQNLPPIAPQIEQEYFSLDEEDTIFVKAILNEYATKIKVENPIYKTIQKDGLGPVFVSSITFNGKEYAGVEGRNKKVSQQLAAHAVIQSILDSDARAVISKIINSKKSLSAAKDKTSLNPPNEVMPLEMQAKSSVGTMASNGNGHKVNMVNDNLRKTAIPEFCMGNSSGALASPVSLHEFRSPKQNVKLAEAHATPIVFVSPKSEEMVVGSSSAKKRKRKAKKNKNKVGSGSEVKNAEVPSGQSTICTVVPTVSDHPMAVHGVSTSQP